MIRRIAALFVAAVALCLTGCGDDDSAPAPIIVFVEGGAPPEPSPSSPPVSAPPGENLPPVIDAVVGASLDIAPNGQIALAVAAHDPNGDPLTYTWTASAGALASANAAATVWTAPAAEGLQMITVHVRDPAGAAAGSTIVIVVAKRDGDGGVDVTVKLNTWPVISKIDAAPSRIDAGEATKLTTTASDADGDALTYQWTSTCAGSFDAGQASVATPRFTLAQLPASGSCVFTVRVDDGRGGHDTAAVSIRAGPGVAPIFAPIIDASFQSRGTAASNETLWFDVTAHDPASLALKFTWTASSGTLSGQSDTAGGTHVNWTAPAGCGPTTASVITVVVTNASGAQTSQPFGVVNLCPTCSDGEKNASETDIDCGPGCQACGVGKACGTAADCAAPLNAAVACTGAKCVQTTCSAGFYDCDGVVGCETASSASDCGACGDACSATETCVNRVCTPKTPPSSWSLVSAVPAPVSVAIAPNGGGLPYVIYVGTAGNGIFRSSDEATWTSAGPPSVVSVAAMPQAISSFASLADGTAQITKDSGATWSPTATSPGAVVAAWIAVSGIGPLGASSDGAGHAVVLNGKSSGTTWVASAPFGSGGGTSIAFGGGTTAYVGVNGAGGGVFKSVNLGAAGFTFATTGFPQPHVLSVAVAASAPTTVLAGTAGEGAGIYSSIDGGATWVPAGVGLGDHNVSALAVDPTNPSRIYAGTSAGLYLSKDGGGSWAPSGLASSAVRAIAVLNGAPSTVYAATSTGLYVTKTGGE